MNILWSTGFPVLDSCIQPACDIFLAQQLVVTILLVGLSKGLYTAVKFENRKLIIRLSGL